MSFVPQGSKTTHLHLRLSAPEKQLLSRAARLQKMSLSRFVLQAALPAAEEIVRAERESQEIPTVFRLDDEAWQELTRLLDAAPRELPALKKLLHSQPVWET